MMVLHLARWVTIAATLCGVILMLFALELGKPVLALFDLILAAFNAFLAYTLWFRVERW